MDLAKRTQTLLSVQCDLDTSQEQLKECKERLSVLERKIEDGEKAKEQLEKDLAAACAASAAAAIPFGTPGEETARKSIKAKGGPSGTKVTNSGITADAGFDAATSRLHDSEVVKLARRYESEVAKAREEYAQRLMQVRTRIYTLVFLIWFFQWFPPPNHSGKMKKIMLWTPNYLEKCIIIIRFHKTSSKWPMIPHSQGGLNWSK